MSVSFPVFASECSLLTKAKSGDFKLGRASLETGDTERAFETFVNFKKLSKGPFGCGKGGVG